MNRIKELREEKNLSMAECARQLNIPYTTYVNYEKDEREPNSEMLIKLSSFFGVSVDYLICRSKTKSPIYPKQNDKANADHQLSYNIPVITDNYVIYPVIGDVAAGYELVASEEWSGEKIEIPVSYLKGHNATDFFALQVKGNSMYPLYLNGDIVLVLKSSSVERSGNIGVVIYDDDNGTLKRIEFDDTHTWIRLSPVNPEYQPRELTGEKLDHCRIIGVPRLLIREVEN